MAHPRVSGENPMLLAENAHGTGSSPRERGKLNSLATGQNRVRLIPA